MKKIMVLIIEDDPACRELLTEVMLEVGRVVHTAKTLAEGYKELETDRPDLIVLDRGLPDGDGVKFCLTLRKDSRYRTIPILMLTARGEVEDRIIGLRLGADDYMPKPFDTEELLARMDGLVRRNQPELADGSGRMQFRGIVMDLRGRQVLADGEEVKVSPREHELLRIFLERPGVVLTRDFLLEAVWQAAAQQTGRKIVDMTVMNLRKKLGRFGALITAVPSYGYKLG